MKVKYIFPDDILGFLLYTVALPINVIINVHMWRALTQSITLCPAGNNVCTDEKDAMVIFICRHGSSEIYNI